MWKRVQLDDTSADAFRKGHPLPETFSKMVLIGKNEIRTVDQIQTQFGLPKPIAEHFAEAAVFFSQLRKIRDRVIHGRSGFGHVFETERGFCVDPKREPFKSFTGWLPEQLLAISSGSSAWWDDAELPLAL
jgi:hypothetical protein